MQCRPGATSLSQYNLVPAPTSEPNEGHHTKPSVHAVSQRFGAMALSSVLMLWAPVHTFSVSNLATSSPQTNLTYWLNFACQQYDASNRQQCSARRSHLTTVCAGNHCLAGLCCAEQSLVCVMTLRHPTCPSCLCCAWVMGALQCISNTISSGVQNLNVKSMMLACKAYITDYLHVTAACSWMSCDLDSQQCCISRCVCDVLFV